MHGAYSVKLINAQQAKRMHKYKKPGVPAYTKCDVQFINLLLMMD